MYLAGVLVPLDDRRLEGLANAASEFQSHLTSLGLQPPIVMLMSRRSNAQAHWRYPPRTCRKYRYRARGESVAAK